MLKRDVASYLAETAGVEGWFFPIDAYLFGMIDEIQKREGIGGNLFEIGVHHGKTALFLARAAASGETLGVCDVFEQQELNRDRSGEGSRELFVANMRRLAPIHAKIFAKPSDQLTTAETTNTCRFFHIDGGHRPEDVATDLQNATAALLPDGVVALDDLFNPNWPGVGEGFYRFVGRGEALVPILIGGNKVYFTRPAAAARYAKYWESWRDFVDTNAFTFDYKVWLGRQVFTAIRLKWVDLDPEGAAKLHT